MKRILPAVLLVLGLKGMIAQTAGVLPKFAGREVTVIAPQRSTDGFYPKGPASICVEGPPQRLCYTAPKEFGNDPTVVAVELKKDLPALLFSAGSGGVSGWSIHFALLVPGTGGVLKDLFASDASFSNQSQHAFWNEPAISKAQIFVIADYIWGPDEGHYGEHRYTVSAYELKHSSSGEFFYYLEDRYMTARKYNLDANADILQAEKQEVLTRLRRIKAAELTPR